jgi:hypothetical protein
MNIHLPVTKGIIFAGCSFTWGQGLYYYSNLPTLKESKNIYNPELVTSAQIEYMKTVRFPRQVANHFKTFELVHKLNGGSHRSIIAWWEAVLGFGEDKIFQVDGTKVRHADTSEISTVVFQLTQPHRCPNLDLGSVSIAYNEAFYVANRNKFQKWLAEKNISIDEYKDYYTRESLEQVKSFLTKCEKRGLRTVVINWPLENVNYITTDLWFLERLLPLTYNGNNYYDMNRLHSKNPEMKISTDYDSFSSPPKDDHPSLKCHNLIAENLIRYLEK